MTYEDFRAIVLSFPGVEEGSSYGQPSFLVRKKFLTRLRREDNSAVFLEVGHDEREILMEAEPQTFHFTAHYKDYPSVLARLETLHPDALSGIARILRGDLLLLLLDFLQQHGRELIVAHAVDSALLIPNHQLRVDPRNLFCDEAVLPCAFNIALEPEANRS